MTETLFDLPEPERPLHAVEPLPPPGAPEPPVPPQTEATMLALLRERFDVTSQGTGRRFVFATHVRDGAGFDRRTADAVALDLWQSTRNELHGFEVKVSRSDWLRELRDPAKHAAVARYCQRWSLVIPSAGMVKPGELPDGWGLIVCISGGAALRAAVPAPWRRADVPPRGFWAAFTRAAVRTEGNRLGGRGPW